ncbi:hypothetical protein DVH05_013116 [Phytophthora capsici]|nr:hypothetical protein DVH05_013116 [Phytophthora capsici]
MHRLVELNTIEQCINVFKIGLVQRHRVKYGFPRIHGLVYDLKNGKLNEMDIAFQSYVRKYRSIYVTRGISSEELFNARWNIVKELWVCLLSIWRSSKWRIVPADA